jgi:hypothetical protein
MEANSAVSGLLTVVGGLVEIAWKPMPERVISLAPALRLGMKYGFRRTVEIAGTNVAIDWRAGILEFCPVRAMLGARVLVDACLAGSIGLLTAGSRHSPRPQVNQRLWLDYGGVASVKWFGTSKLFIELAGGPTFPILRDRFRVDPGGVATLAPPLGWSLAVGGGWRP